MPIFNTLICKGLIKIAQKKCADFQQVKIKKDGVTPQFWSVYY
ncbi:hypothetical protein QUF50_06925 [Thiotrichales bacterium HSG1]|nr:hypothetical protein [Thiotrichales bacterium HSG1]